MTITMMTRDEARRRFAQAVIENDTDTMGRLEKLHNGLIDSMHHLPGGSIGGEPIQIPMLVWALSSDKWQSFDWMIRSGADLHVCCNVRNATPLYYAVSNGKLDYAERLLQAGADVRLGMGPLPSGLSETPLQCASQMVNAPMIALLQRYQRVLAVEMVAASRVNLKPSNRFRLKR